MPQCGVSQIATCTTDEADGRILLHAAHTSTQGHCNIIIQASDTDVMVLVIATAPVLRDCQR